MAAIFILTIDRDGDTTRFSSLNDFPGGSPVPVGGSFLYLPPCRHHCDT